MSIQDYIIKIYVRLFGMPIEHDFLARCHMPIYEALEEVKDWIYLEYVDPKKKSMVLDELFKATFNKYQEEYDTKNIYYCYD